MPRKPRSPAPPPVVLTPLEVIAQQLCAIPRVPYNYGDGTTGRVILEGLPDTSLFIDAVKALRFERCDKSLLDEALVLQRTIAEERDRLDQLLAQLPKEALDR